MDEQQLSMVQGNVISLGPHKDHAGQTHYDNIRLRISDTRQTTVNNVTVAESVNRYLAPNKPVTLYFIQSPSGEKSLFAIEADQHRADVIEVIGRAQVHARKHAIKWVILSIPLCLVLVGLALLPASIQSLIKLARSPKPADMRAFMAAHPPLRQEASAAAVP